MLEYADNIGASLLYVLFGLLGINQLPESSSGSWEIEKKWVEVQDRTYMLSMTSRNLSQECSAVSKPGKSGFVVFPQTYMGRMRIFVNKHLIYTNSMSRPWNISQLMSKPLLSCDLFGSASEVRVEITAYFYFFTSVTGYPEVEPEYPQEYVFYEEVFVVASIVALALGIIGAILLVRITGRGDAFLYFAQQFSFFMLVGSHVPGRYFDISLDTAHSIVVIGGFLGLISMILNTFEVKQKLNYFFSSAVLSLGVTYLCHGYKHLTHLLVELLIVSALVGSICMMLYKILQVRLKKDYLESSLYFVFFLLILFDGAGSQVNRDSYFHLSSIALVASSIAFLRVLTGFNREKQKLIVANLRLESEAKTIDVVTSLNHSYKEIIHDIKSPLMSLKFSLVEPAKNTDLLVMLSERISSILSRISDDRLKRMIDWYSLRTFTSKLIELCEQKRSQYPKLKVHFENETEVPLELRYDPVDAITIFDEVLDNAIKYSDGSLIVSFAFDGCSKFSLVFSNALISGGPIESLNSIGYGIGLINIKKKMEDVGGSASVIRTDNRFEVVLTFVARN